MSITVPTRLSCKNIIKLMLYFICFERLLESIGIPHSVIFILDVANIWLFLNIIVNKRIIKQIQNPIIATQLLVVTVGIIVALFNDINLFLIIWALRNLCRFWIFFIACKEFLKKDDIVCIFRTFIKIYVANFIVLLVQYLLGFRGDYLGGIFGTSTGANAYCNIFLLIVLTYEIVSWFEKKENNFAILGMISSSLFIAAITEMKIFFVEVVFIFIGAFILVCIIEGKIKVLLRALGIALIGVAVLLIGIRIMSTLYPNFANFFTVDQFIYHTTRESGYSGSGDLNRLTAIKTINESLFTESHIFYRFFGLGLGATEYGSINILTSAFYKKYSYWHYFWFSHAWMYLEIGYFGLILYIIGFILNGMFGLKFIKRYKKNKIDTIILMTGIILSIITVILYMYNQSLRLEIAYLLYFCFAVMKIGEYNNASRTLK